MSKKGKKHHGQEAGQQASESRQGSPIVDTQAGHDFGPPIGYDYDGKTGTIHSLEEAIAFVEPLSGTFEHPDEIWRTVFEALHFARTSGLNEELVNARGMLEDALKAPRGKLPEDDTGMPGV